MKLKRLLFLMVLFLIPFVKVNAASFSVSASSKNVTVGSNVTIYINGKDVTGKVNITSSNTSVLSSSTNSVWIEPNGSVTFKANKVGSSTITVTSSSLSDGSGNDVNLGSKTITINVVEKQAPKVVSSNNSLSNLVVEGYELDPIFDPGTTEYSVIVKEGTEKVNISAKAADSKASINGTGEKEVSEGLNVLSVIVTAENGYEKEYKLNIIVEEEPIVVRINDLDVSLVKQANALPQVSSLYSPSTLEYIYEVDGEEKQFEIPTYISEVTGFTLVGVKDNKGNINLYIYKDGKFTKYEELNFKDNIVIFPRKPKKVLDGYKKVKLELDNKEISAYQKEDSNYYLIYGLNVDNNNETWYKYDKEDNSIQKYDYEEIDKLTKENDKYLITIYTLSGIIILFVLSSIIMLYKLKKVER